jgi:hypothetical protein
VTASAAGTFVIGDVVDYTPDVDYTGRPARHCREGVATVAERGDGTLYLADTFWTSGGDRHVLTPTEAATATLRFNTDGYRELGYNENRESIPREHWQEIPSQHGLVKRRFVRIEAGPTWEQKHANARQDIIDAQHEVASALSKLQSARTFAEYLHEREDEGVKPW